MFGNLRPLFFPLLLAVFLAFPASAEEVLVAVVQDGPAPTRAAHQEPFERELVDLLEGEFDLTFQHFDGDWTRQSIEEAASRAYADPEVDMVLVVGLVANQILGLRDDFPKPTFLPLVFDAGLLGLPRAGSGSGKHNLNYLSDDIQFDANLESFLSVVPFKRVGLLVDGIILEAVEEIARESRRVAAARQLEVVSIPYDDPDQDLVALIPQDVDAVMVGGGARLDEAAFDRLVQGLIDRGLPSFSFFGDESVQAGLLTTDSPTSDFDRLARRNALHMQSVLLGERAEDLPIDFESRRRLYINMRTANALDVWPRFDILVEAVLFGVEFEQDGPPWTLADVAHQVVETNLDLIAQRFGTKAGAREIRIARANLLPQVSAGINVTQLDGANSSVAAGLAAQRSTTGSLTVTQLLFSDAARAGVEIQNVLQESREAELEQLRLDLVQAATVAFLEVLRAETLFRVQRDNLELSRANLQLAQDRLLAGSANASDVYRWESQLATAQQEAIAARTTVTRARENLNRLLNRPLESPYRLLPSTLSDPALLIEESGLPKLIDNPKSFRRLMISQTELGIERAPELRALQAAIAAKEREILTERRSFYLPSVSLQGQLNQVLEEDRKLGPSLEGDDDWSLALVASLPLFEGGARRAEVERAELELQQLETQYESLRDQIEQNIRSQMHLTNASFLSIPLAEKAAEAARQSLELVTDAYSQGAVSILDLLDAQSASLQAREGAANAVHNFLIDLMNAQRAAGRFDFFLTDEERRAVIRQIRETMTIEATDP